MHTFKSHLSWQKHPQAEDTANRSVLKNHTVSIEGKDNLIISAAKAFKGDGSKWNPEDMLLSSLMSCHMMSFLYVCGQNGVEVLSYEDNATALLTVQDNGGGKIQEVRLHPMVQLADLSQKEMVLSLSEKAHQLCFIANSCNFEIHIEMKFSTCP